MKLPPWLALALAITAPAWAQAPAASGSGSTAAAPVTRIQGAVAAVSAEGLTVRDASGQAVTLGLAPNLTVVAMRPVAKGDIKAGDFVASANLSQSDGVGRSIEMRVFEPGSRAGEGNRAMTQAGAAPGQMMTNATVTRVTQTSAGLQLDVQYPGGLRRLVVPPDVTIMGSYPVDPAALQVGTPVAVTASRSADGILRATRIQIAAAPPTR